MYFFVMVLQIIVIEMTFGLHNPKIAIIGAGIGGTSCAYFLRQAIQNNVSIVVFERDVIGGRLATISLDNNKYEAGGSIIHPRNKYMSDFVEVLGLNQKQPAGGRWGIYNGQKFIFKDSKWSFVSMMKLFWRYGWDTFRLQRFISSMLNDFSKIYKYQDQGLAYVTVPALLQSMSSEFPNMTQQSLKSFMTKNGFSTQFLQELAQSVTLVNYGQTIDIGAFVGAVALAGSEPGLWSVQGGNNQVPSGLLGLSKSEVISAEVSSISLIGDHDYEVAFRQPDSNYIERKKFDCVVIAAPLMKGHTTFRFDNFSTSFDSFFKTYHRTVATFVQGKLKPSAFSSESVPDVVLINNDSYMLNSIGQLQSVFGEITKDQPVYKVFSKLPLTKEQINLLFDDIKLVKAKDWMAYPHYSPPDNIPPFVLHPDLYYINAIEWSASAMEMSVISAKNIALLIYNEWKNKLHQSDLNKNTQKDEL